MPDATPTAFLIDDDQAVRDAVGLLLQASGLAVETFASATDFLDAGVVQRPGCLVLDVRMPGLSGLDLQRQLQLKGDRIPIIFMTGHGDVPMAIRAMKAGAFDFIEKPFQGQTLLARIQEALALDARERGRQATGLEYARAAAAVQRIGVDIARAWAGFDVILTPTLAQPPALVGSLRNDADPAEDFAAQTRFTPWTSVYNLSGGPAISLPLHTAEVDGAVVPIGVMFGAAHGAEELLLSLAGQLEAAVGWEHPFLVSDPKG